MDKSERSENLVKSELLRACKLLYRQKLVYATAGNVSHRCGDSIFITATGTSLGYVTPDSLVRLDMDGNVLEGGRPSSEYRMHLAIYNKFPKIKAVVHTHPTAATTLACLQTPIKTTLLAEAELFLGEVACAPYADPGTAELAEKMIYSVHGSNACLLESHGLVTWGATMKEALYRTELAEFTAKININAKSLGY